MNKDHCAWSDCVELEFAWIRLQEHRGISQWHEKDMLAVLLEEAFDEGVRIGKLEVEP